MANYSNIANVRTESGFDWNTNILDTLLTSYLEQSHGVVVSYVASRYNITKLVASTDFTGSQAEQMLVRVETLLASWYLMIKEYWPDGANTDKDWYKKVDEAMELLMMISKWDLRLIKIDWSEFELWAVKKTTWTFYGSWAVVDWEIFKTTDKF